MKIWILLKQKLVGNKAKGRISKRVFQETKHAKFSEKKNHFLPPDTHTLSIIVLKRFWITNIEYRKK